MNILVEMVKYHTASSHLSALDYLGLILKLVSFKATFVRDALLRPCHTVVKTPLQARHDAVECGYLQQSAVN